ncbi:MAG TPA: SRPBCC family protein [Flavisolibacter sp.]|nr:SRPBCC family protein [Flavisolibacter sp.]
MTHEPFVIERSYKASVEKVWKAITDREQMKEWYFDIAEFKPEVGFEFTFNGENEGRVFVHLCKITEVVPFKKLQYSWQYEDREGLSYVTFELLPEGENTKLKLTHEGLETFPQDRDSKRENFVEGWTYITGIALKDYLEKTKIKKQIRIAATQEKVWNVLVDPAMTKQWANEFSEGAYVETDWQKDSEVVWKDKDGNVGTRGKVVMNEAPSKLQLLFYDDATADAATPLGTYAENYTVSTKDGETLLTIEAGPLTFAEAESFSLLWEKGLQKMKELAEE